MKRLSKLLSSVAAAAVMTCSAQAATINVGGVVWNPNSIFDFSTGDDMVETIVGNVGDVLNGYAIITKVNGALNSGINNFCPGCELTYTFTGYTITNVDTILGQTFLTFSGGTINVYVDDTPDFDALTQSTAADGVLWLSLAGHPHLRFLTGNTGTLHSSATPILGDDGSGSGYFDVTGGLAAANFDTNTRPTLQSLGPPTFDFADFQFTSSFQLIPGGATFVSDDGKTYGLFGTNDLQGNSVPEPGTLFLIGLSLLGFAAIGRRARLEV